MNHNIFIGTAGWAIPPQVRELFVGEGSNLERYARFLNSTEINSSFYRDHKPETYQKWSDSTPDDFRFSVKLNKYFTRDKKLTEAGDKLRESLLPIMELKEKLGALLIQIPASVEFSSGIADRFFSSLRHHYEGVVVFEPRNPTWISDEAAGLLFDFGINKVLADPEPCRLPSRLRKQCELVTYFRLHGSPEMYKSSYESEVLHRLAQKIEKTSQSVSQVWCVFDNTTFGHALDNALELNYLLENGLEAEAQTPTDPPTQPHAAH